MISKILLIVCFACGFSVIANGQRLVADFAGGNSLRFDGDAIFGRAASDFPDGNNDRTLAVLFRIDEFRSEESFLGGYGAFGTFNGSYHLGTSNGRLFFSQWGSAIFGPELKTGVWYEAIVNNRGDSVRLFLNGCLVASGELPIRTPVKSDFYLGRLPGDAGEIRQLVGEIGGARLFDSALDPAEIGPAINGIARAGVCSQLN